MPNFNTEIEIESITLVVNGSYIETERGDYTQPDESYNIEVEEVLLNSNNIYNLLDDRILILIDEQIALNLEL